MLRYLVSEPRARDRGAGPPPLLCFLHGYDEASPLAIERALTRHGPLSPTAAAVARDRFVLVAPQLPRAGDLWHRYASEVASIVEMVRRDAGADPARAYLTGFSFGGNGVFDLATAVGGLWAALWAVDPTRVPRRDPQLPVWLSIGEAARPHLRGFIRALRLRPAEARLPARNLADDRYYVDEGLDHVGAAASAYGDARIYEWMLGCVRR